MARLTLSRRSLCPSLAVVLFVSSSACGTQHPAGREARDAVASGPAEALDESLTAQPLPETALRVRRGMLVDAAGKRFMLHGVNWFGFDDGNTSVDGLWQGPDSLTLDFATVVRRLKTLGFNAVRLPFSFQELQVPPKTQARACSEVSEADFASSMVPPGQTPSGVAPQLRVQAPIAAGMCSSYLPTQSTFERFVWVVQFFARNGFYVVLDNQLNLDKTAVDNPTGWVQQWVALAQAVSADPEVAPRLIFDIFNEPDSANLRWQASGALPGAGDLYLTAMDSLYKVNPAALFFVEGTGQGGPVMNWGDGLITDPATIAATGISDPNPFFTALMTRPYLGRVVLAPHVYPPSVSGATQGFTGSALFARLDKSFGDKSVHGYCSAGRCHQFALVIGETGSAMQLPTDVQMLDDFALWCMRRGGSAEPDADTQHHSVSGWFWWAWNANSGGTGGLVASDWRTLVWQKIDYLRSLGLHPWK